MVKTDYNYTIKVTELMVDNWVTEELSIDKEKNPVIRIVHIDKSTFREGRYFPIVVTPNLLKEIGFKYHKDAILKVRCWESDDNRIIITNNEDYNGDGKTWYIHVDNADFDTTGTGTFSYLHQLQNILTTNDYNLEINLKD